MLKVVLIILYDSNKKFLLQLRTDDARILPSYWAFFGGGIKNNEIPLDAVIRETYEELNYNLIKPQLFLEQHFKIDHTKGYMYVYIEYFKGDKSKLRLQEGQKLEWYEASETSSLKMIEHDRQIIKSISLYLSNKNRSHVVDS